MCHVFKGVACELPTRKWLCSSLTSGYHRVCCVLFVPLFSLNLSLPTCILFNAHVPKSNRSNSNLVLVYGIKCIVVSQQSALHDHQRGGWALFEPSVHNFICSSVYTFSHTLTQLPSHTHPYTYPHINDNSKSSCRSDQLQ